MRNLLMKNQAIFYCAAFSGAIWHRLAYVLFARHDGESTIVSPGPK